jgi:RNA polymerase sigma factor (sigma-70 family)
MAETAETAATAAKAGRPSDAEVARVLKMAQRFANRRAWKGELGEAAQDAATDAIMWSLKNYDPSRGATFEAFALAAVRSFVHRHIGQRSKQLATRPEVAAIHDLIPASERQCHDNGNDYLLPDGVADLPHELRDVVRFFYVDRFDLHEISLLMGTSKETARLRLKEAAKILGRGEKVHRELSTGSRRLRR